LSIQNLIGTPLWLRQIAALAFFTFDVVSTVILFVFSIVAFTSCPCPHYEQTDIMPVSIIAVIVMPLAVAVV
jgi:hypothetical protein